MAAELSQDLTFFNGIINDTKLNKTTKKCRASQKPNELKPPAKRTSKSSQNENKTPENTGAKKPRASKTGERKPLDVICNKPKTSPNTKKTGVSPTKIAVPTRKTRSMKASPTQAKPTAKERQSLPKIVIHQDSPEKRKVQKRECKTRLSKSLDGSPKRQRQNVQEAKPKCRLSHTGTQKSRSVNDLTAVKTPKTKPKSPEVEKKKKSSAQPRKSSSRLPKFKQGQPQFDEMVAKLENLFPNVDPIFIKSQFVKLKGSLPETIEFMIIKEKTNELPTRTEYVRRLEAEKLYNKFMENFSVENFLKMIPDPWEYFLKTEKHNSVNYLGHSLYYLKSKYKKHYVQAIHTALAKNGNSLYLANKELNKKSRALKTRATNRSKYECEAGRPTTFNVQFMHEVAFIENEAKIKSYIKKAETTRLKKFKEAQITGSLLECQSCNDFALLRDDAVNCPANHVFCKDCVVKYVQIEMEKNNFQFKCLMKCEERFSMNSLQAILSPFLMTQIIKRNQLEEIKSAGIEDLVYCPFCYYVAILPAEISIFKCMNPSCMIESCRWCRQFNHIPLKCQELENFDKTILEEQVQKQEEEEEEEKKVTPKCSQCNGEFVKIKDTNLMVCSCGATICCICRQPRPECSHVHAFPAHRLSSSTDDGESIQIDDETAEDSADDTEGNPEGSSDSELLANIMEMLPSDSDVF